MRFSFGEFPLPILSLCGSEGFILFSDFKETQATQAYQ